MGLSQIIPPNYEFAGKWQLRLKGWPLVWLSISQIVIFGISLILTFIVIVFMQIVFLQTTLVGEWIPYDRLQLPIILIGVIVALFIVHEAIHGFTFLVFGGRPHFGVKLIGKFFPVAFYTTSKLPLSRNKYLLVTLAPFLILTVVFLVIGIIANNKGVVALAIFVVAMNVSSSIGDIIVAWKIWRRNRWTIFEDTKEGLKWYVPSESH